MSGRLFQRHTRRRRSTADNDDAKVHRGSSSDWTISLRRLVIWFRSKSFNGRSGPLFLALCGAVTMLAALSGSTGESVARRSSSFNDRGDSRTLRYRSASLDLPQRTFEPRFIPPSGLSDMCDLGYQLRPRSLGYYFKDDESIGAQRLDPYFQRRYRERSVHVHPSSLEARALLVEGDCVEQHSWQLTSFPACNQVFEFDLTDLGADVRRDERVRLIDRGYWRDVWFVREYDGTKRALKTMRYEHDFELQNYDWHRKDALASERLTSSPNVVDIFGFCGNSGVFEFGDGGDVREAIWPPEGESELTTKERLRIALQIATAIGDVHNFDEEGKASVAHTDIKPSQFILVKGKYKLNDFNRARFIRWNHKKNESCGFHVGNNPGKFRAPEEYAYDLESEKIDIYSMGNMFYCLLTKLWPFEQVEIKKAQEKIMDGERPPVDNEIRNSNDPAVQALIKAMEMCWVQDPQKRSSARTVEAFLKEGVAKIDY